LFCSRTEKKVLSKHKTDLKFSRGLLWTTGIQKKYDVTDGKSSSELSETPDKAAAKLDKKIPYNLFMDK